MKVKGLLLSIALSAVLLGGCTGNAKTTPSPSPAASPKATASPQAAASPKTSPDTVTTASIVDNAAAFEKAVGSTGTWIICTTKDLTITKDLVLEGEFKNGKKDANGKDVIQRKVALYTQDNNKNITARFTLTIPKLTVTSPEASIQHGTLKGDLYVSVKNFQLIDTTVDGNVYFTTDDAKSTFKMDATSKVTGKQELKK